MVDSEADGAMPGDYSRISLGAVLVDEIHQIVQKMVSGQIPMPGAQGSQAGVGEDRPVSATGGQTGMPMG